VSRKPFESNDRPDEGSGITGKRKKSWRELDAKRGTSKHVSRDEERQQERLQQSGAYEKYKKGLDSLFTGGALPDGLAQTFDPEGKRKVQKEAMQKVTEAPDRKAWAERVVEYLEKYPEMPDDAFFLDSLLDHPKDRIVDKALGKLELLQADGKLPKDKAPRSLEQRLRTIEMTSLDDEMKQRAKTLRSRL
jgi:hypothetical protein